MTTINKLRIGLIIGNFVMIIWFLTFLIDYTNLSWTNNATSYTVIIGMILLIIVNVGSINLDKKRSIRRKIKDDKI